MATDELSIILILFPWYCFKDLRIWKSVQLTDHFKWRSLPCFHPHKKYSGQLFNFHQNVYFLYYLIYFSIIFYVIDRIYNIKQVLSWFLFINLIVQRLQQPFKVQNTRH